MRFKDKVVFVVGGNSGIGLASAQAFAAEGGIVHLTGRDQATIDRAVASIAGATGHHADVADLESLDPVIAAIKASPTPTSRASASTKISRTSASR